jgi:hypothetical protein
MQKTTLRNEHTVKMVANSTQIISDRSSVPPGVVVVPMVVLAKPEKIKRK